MVRGAYNPAGSDCHRGAASRMARKKDEIRYKDVIARGEFTPPGPVTVLTGDEIHLKRDLESRYIRTLLGDDPPQDAVIRIREPKKDIAPKDVVDELQTPSILAPRKVVIVEDADGFLRAHGPMMVPFIESGFPCGHLILEVKGVDRRTAAARALTRAQAVIDCPRLYEGPAPWETGKPDWDSELSRWVVFRVKEKGRTISAQDAHRLHRLTGNRLGVIDEEIEKLCVRTSEGGRISRDDIDAIGCETRSDTVFELLDHVMEGSSAEALASLERIFRNGYRTQDRGITFEPSAIALSVMGALGARLRNLRRGRAVIAGGGRRDDLVSQGIVRPAFWNRFRREIESFPEERIGAALGLLREADRKLKTGAIGDPRLLLECLLIRVARAAPP